MKDVKKFLSVVMSLAVLLSMFNFTSVAKAQTPDTPKQSNFPQLNWLDAEHDEYKVYVSTNSNFDGSMVFSGIQSSEFTVPQKLQFATLYYWKVEAVKNESASIVGSGEFTTIDSEEILLYGNDFEGEQTGDVLPDYSTIDAAGLGKYIVNSAGSVEIADGPGGTNKAIKLNRLPGMSNVSTSPGVTYKFGRPMTDGIMSVTYAVYRDADHSGAIVYTLDENAFQYDSASTSIINDWGTHFIDDGRQWSSTGVASTTGQWYQYKIDADLRKRTFDLYINDTKANAEPVAMKAGHGINNFSIFTHFQDGQHSGTYYVDNIRISLKQKAPEAVLPLDHAKDVPTIPSFQWKDTGADSYSFILSDKQDFSRILEFAHGIPTTGYELPQNVELAMNTTYYWKVLALKDGYAYAVDNAFSFTTALDAQGNRKPSIFETAPESAGPGEVVQMIGENFDARKVYLYRLSDSTYEELVAQVGISNNVGDLTFNADELRAIDPAASSQNTMSVAVPQDVAYGQYALFTENAGVIKSNAVFQNKTEVLFAYPDKINQLNEREVRVIGVNLSYNNDTSKSFVFLKDQQGNVIPVTPKSITQYEVKFDLPEGIADGTYEIWLNNGHGGAYGWGAVQTVEVYSHSGYHTVYNILDYGATANDDVVDTAAIQSAIDAVSAAGGGTVEVPEGTFTIDNKLMLKSKVSLTGQGKDESGSFKSVIKFKDGDPIGDSAGGQGAQMMVVQSDTVIEKLKIVGSVSVDRGIVLEDGAHDVTIRDNHIDNYFPTTGIKGYYSGISHAGSDGAGGEGVPYFRRVVVENNYFKGNMAINMTRLYYSRISNNTIKVTGVAGMIFGMAAKNIVEGNRMNGLDDNGKQIGSRGIYFGSYGDFRGSIPVEMNYVKDNVIEHTGTAGNDGEIIVFDNFADSPMKYTEFYGDVASADQTSLTFNGANFQPDAFKDHYVVVVSGRGLGQWKKIVSNTSDTMYVEGSWTVIPNQSKVLAAKPFFRNIVTGNTAMGVKSGGYYGIWGLGMKNIFDGNRDESQVAQSLLAAIDYGEHQNRYGINYYNTIKNSGTKDTTIGYIGYLLNAPRNSIISLGNVAKNNNSDTVHLSYSGNLNTDIFTRNAYANVIEHNSVRTIKIDVNGDNTLLRENKISGGYPRYDDKGTGTVILEYPLLDAPVVAYSEPEKGLANIQWQGVDGAEGYYILRKVMSKGNYNILNGGAPVSGVSFEDATVEPGTFYQYLVIPWNSGTGEGYPSKAFTGFKTENIYSSSSDFSGVQGSNQWYYRNGASDLAYTDGKWTDGSGSVVLEKRKTTITGTTSAEWQWRTPHNGQLHYYGYLTGISEDPNQVSLKVMLGDTELKTSQVGGSDGINFEGVTRAGEGENLRFIVTGTGSNIVELRTEFAVDYARDVPVPAMPQDGYDVVDRSPQFRWVPVSDAENYEFVLADRPDFTNPIVDKTGITETGYNYSGNLEPSKIYYWKVIARKGEETWEGPAASFKTVDMSRQVIATYNFNLEQTGKIPGSFRTAGSLLHSYAGVDQFPGEFNKSFQLTTEGKLDQRKVSFDLPNELTSGKYELSWKVNVNGDPTTHFSLWFGSTDQSSFSLLAGYGRYMMDWKYTNQLIKVDKWQNIKVIVDLDAKKYSVFVDGSKLISENRDEFPFNDPSVKTVTMALPYDQWVGGVHFDDITIAKIIPGIPSSKITVTGENGATRINKIGGTLQMMASVEPADATDKSVAWSVLGEDGTITDIAQINETGLLTAKKNGKVKVVASAMDGSGVTGEAVIVIDSIPPAIILSTTPTTPTKGSVTVTVEADGTGSEVAAVKWAQGNRDIAYFAEAGQHVTNNSLPITANDTYTVYARDGAGNEATKTIKIDNIATMEGLSVLLESYIASGDVTGPLVSQLRNSLRQAIHHRDAGRMKQADHFLNKFLDDLNNKALQKHVTASAKAALEQYVRAMLE